MIKDIPNNVDVPIVTDPLIGTLWAVRDHTFYLTGSRFAELTRQGSDWDFFAADDKGHVIDWLKSVGFKILSNSDETYNSDDVHPYTNLVMGKNNVHVQVVNDLELARATRDAVYGTPRLRSADILAREDGQTAFRTDLWVDTARLLRTAKNYKKPMVSLDATGTEDIFDIL
jgi:hypothetical protein